MSALPAPESPAPRPAATISGSGRPVDWRMSRANRPATARSSTGAWILVAGPSTNAPGRGTSCSGQGTIANGPDITRRASAARIGCVAARSPPSTDSTRFSSFSSRTGLASTADARVSWLCEVGRPSADSTMMGMSRKRGCCAQLVVQLPAVHAGHAQVQQDQRRRVAGPAVQRRQRLPAIGRAHAPRNRRRPGCAPASRARRGRPRPPAAGAARAAPGRHAPRRRSRAFSSPRPGTGTDDAQPRPHHPAAVGAVAQAELATRAQHQRPRHAPAPARRARDVVVKKRSKQRSSTSSDRPGPRSSTSITSRSSRVTAWPCGPARDSPGAPPAAPLLGGVVQHRQQQHLQLGRPGTAPAGRRRPRRSPAPRTSPVTDRHGASPTSAPDPDLQRRRQPAADHLGQQAHLPVQILQPLAGHVRHRARLAGKAWRSSKLSAPKAVIRLRTSWRTDRQRLVGEVEGVRLQQAAAGPRLRCRRAGRRAPAVTGSRTSTSSSTGSCG